MPWFRWLLIWILLLSLTACGSKGPLVPPEDPPETPAKQ
jgi:predicted small lipoprotein YifL